MPEPQADISLTPSARRHHRDMLILCVLAILLALILQVQPDHQHVGVAGAASMQLPGTCLSHEIFGVSCPGCGLTRSIVLLAHGNLAGSFRMHRIGWAMALLIVAQLPYRILCLRRDRPVLPTWLLRTLSITMITLLVGNWIVNVLLGLPGPQP